MINVIIKIAGGLALSIIAIFSIALVFGERKTLRKESAYHYTIGKIIKVWVGILILVVIAIISLSHWISVWFLLALIPPLVMTAMFVLPEIFPQKELTINREKADSVKTWIITEEKYERARDFLINYAKRKSSVGDMMSLLEKTYWNKRKDFPEQDEHFYLAKTLFMPFAARAHIGQNPIEYIAKIWKQDIPISLIEEWKSRWEEYLILFCYAQTEIFSILEPPDSIRALSIFVAYKEFPTSENSFSDEFDKIMKPIMQMTHEKLSEIYKIKNPVSNKLIEKTIK